MAKKTFIETMKERFENLVIKLSGFEGVIWITATVGLFKGIVPADSWIILSLGVAGIKTFQKVKNVEANYKSDNATEDI